MDRPDMAGDVLSRRALLTRASNGFAALTIATAAGLVTPAQAHAQGTPLTVLTDNEATALGALGDVLVPGAREAGVVNFVDAELAAPNSKLTLRYLDWPGPLPDFYRANLAALDTVAMTRHNARFAGCTPDQQTALVAGMAQGTLVEWTGPPAPLFFFVARSDAIDVYYGTVDGFALLDVPYQAHILPPARW